MKNRTIHYIGLVVLIMLLATASFAQENDSHNTHGNDSHSHNNHLALFIGNTSQKSFDTNSFTLGLDYMYFFPKSEHWGISAFGEIIMGDHTEWLFGLPVVYKFNKGFWLRSGPGLELAKDNENKVEYHAILRVGGGYDFQLKRIILSPSIDLDGWRKHPALVLGLNIGFGF